MRHHVKTATTQKLERSNRKSTAAAGLASEADQALYEQLKAARGVLAKTKKVPAYVIFHDKTLVELAQQKPDTLEGMLDISGIGETKLKRYGQPLLDVILHYGEAA